MEALESKLIEHGQARIAHSHLPANNLVLVEWMNDRFDGLWTSPLSRQNLGANAGQDKLRER
jgi:hypothetical protein